MASSQIKLKLLVDINAGSVVYAEAEKDFIDFLIHLLSLPVVTAARLLREKTMDVGSICSLYRSLQKLPDSYLQPDQNKSTLLNPGASISTTGIPLVLSNPDFSTKESYTCSNCYSYVTDDPNLHCPGCVRYNYRMDRKLTVHPPRQQQQINGFLKGLVTYIVMDDLEFTPMSTKMVVYLLNKYDVKDVSALEEIEVDLGVEEGLKLLKLSLECNTVLTSFYHEISSTNYKFLSLKYGGNISTSTEIVEVKSLEGS